VTAAFDSLAACADPAMVVVTTAIDGERAGCLVGFHAQSSIEPPRYCVWLSKANHTYRVAQRATHLAVHFLSAADFDLAEWFGTRTGDTVDKFADLAVTVAQGGTPVLDDCPNRLVLRRTALLDEGGDHICVVGDVIAVETAGTFAPLRLSNSAGLRAGHDNDERNEPPTERAGVDNLRDVAS
jgi:flavin reductase (DIM6/NTAB) family NADH-FMN oxidoreductase RutF